MFLHQLITSSMDEEIDEFDECASSSSERARCKTSSVLMGTKRQKVKRAIVHMLLVIIGLVIIASHE